MDYPRITLSFKFRFLKQIRVYYAIDKMTQSNKKKRANINKFNQVPFDYRLLSLILQLLFSRFVLGIIFICYLVACAGPVEVFPF